MNEEIILPNSQYIDIDLGLKYLNANKKLYLKILNSFLTRYEVFDIDKLEADELPSQMHTLKGLAATLGMVLLSHLAKELQTQPTQEVMMEFSNTLTAIISDLNEIQKRTLLIIDNSHDNIEVLIHLLGDNHDVMVATTKNDVIESINSEQIEFALLGASLNLTNIKKHLIEKKISIIEFTKPIDEDHIVNLIKSVKK